MSYFLPFGSPDFFVQLALLHLKQLCSNSFRMGKISWLPSFAFIISCNFLATSSSEIHFSPQQELHVRYYAWKNYALPFVFVFLSVVWWRYAFCFLYKHEGYLEAKWQGEYHLAYIELGWDEATNKFSVLWHRSIGTDLMKYTIDDNKQILHMEGSSNMHIENDYNSKCNPAITVRTLQSNTRRCWKFTLIVAFIAFILSELAFSDCVCHLPWNLVLKNLHCFHHQRACFSHLQNQQDHPLESLNSCHVILAYCHHFHFHYLESLRLYWFHHLS